MSDLVERLKENASDMAHNGEGKAGYEPELAAVMDEAATELQRLQAIVDKLPKTADGKTMCGGETVYTLGGSEWEVACDVSGWCAQEGWMDGDPRCPISLCYSTREAAEAARGEA